MTLKQIIQKHGPRGQAILYKIVEDLKQSNNFDLIADVAAYYLIDPDDLFDEFGEWK